MEKDNSIAACYKSERNVLSRVFDPDGNAVSYGDIVDHTNATHVKITELRAEIERLRKQYIELCCAVWACPADEYEDDHAATVAEAESDVMRTVKAEANLAEAEVEIKRLQAKIETMEWADVARQSRDKRMAEESWDDD